jgi:hypothetical protein
MKGALGYPIYDLKYLMLPGVKFYQSADEYQSQTGTVAPWDPQVPVKRWADTRPDLGAWANYSIPALQGAPGLAVPVITGATLWKAFAASVNIPPRNVESAAFTEIQFPIRPLWEDEELATGLGGVIVVHNVDLYAKLTGTGPAVGLDLSPVIALLNQIIAGLKKAGIGV